MSDKTKYISFHKELYAKEAYPVEHDPNPTTKDYIKGFFIRYFVQPKSDLTQIIEIDKKQFGDYFKTDIGINKNAYNAVELKWRLTGQAYDSFDGNIRIRPGVWHSNERVVKIKEKTIPNLSNKIKDYIRFALIDRSVVSPDGLTTTDNGHNHVYTVDKDGNGWAMEIQHEENPKIRHKHKIVNWDVKEAQSNCFPNCKTIYGHQGTGPHIHNINKK